VQIPGESTEFVGFQFLEHQIDRDVEQCAKALERGGFERMSASEPIKGVFGGPEYRGGYTCTSVEGSNEQRSEGKAGLLEPRWA
jgi:hypothetical protein